MPKRKVWSSEERRMAAVAYIHTTQDCVVGRHQTSASFWDKVASTILQIPTNEVRDEESIRGTTAIKSFLSNTLFPDINKFNTSLLQVHASKPSGVTDHEIVNMAVALHLKVATCRDYNMKNFDSTKWVNYSSWQVLKTINKFTCPIPVVLNPLTTTAIVSTTSTVESEENETGVTEVAASVATEAAEVQLLPAVQIGQKQAKRDRYKNGNSNSTANEEELKRIRLVMDERNKIVYQQQKKKDRQEKIDELRLLLKITKTSQPILYETTRQQLVTLLMTPVTVEVSDNINNCSDSDVSEMSETDTPLNVVNVRSPQAVVGIATNTDIDNVSTPQAVIGIATNTDIEITNATQV